MISIEVANFMHKFDTNNQPIMFKKNFFKVGAVHSQHTRSGENKFFLPRFLKTGTQRFIVSNSKELKCEALSQVNIKN